MSLNRKAFNIVVPDDPGLRAELKKVISQKLKPYGAFGFLESLLMQLAENQHQVPPLLRYPALLIFAGDHGFSPHLPEAAGYPTASEILHFLQGNSLLHSYNRTSRFKIKMVDAGVNYSFESNLNYWLHHGNRLIGGRVADGTSDFTIYPALTTATALQAFDLGIKLVNREFHYSANYLAFSAAGRGSSVAALALAAAALDLRPDELVAQSDVLEGIPAQEALALAETALKKHPKSHDPFTILTLFGGYELPALTGAMLQAAERRMSFMVDNLPAAAALLMASQMQPPVLHFASLASGGNTRLHRILVEQLKLKPLLDLGQQHAPGICSTMAFPLVRTAVRHLHYYPQDDNGGEF